MGGAEEDGRAAAERIRSVDDEYVTQPIGIMPEPLRAVVEAWQPEPPRPRLWPMVVLWSVIAALLLGAGASTVGSLQRDVYGAGAFVSRYLDAIARHDARGALAVPGVRVDPEVEAELPADASSVLLRGDVLGSVTAATVESVEPGASGTVVVTASYLLDAVAHETQYTVRQTDARFGVLPQWRFEVSPIAAIDVTVARSTSFDANGLTLDVRSTHPTADTGFGAEGAYLVLTPATYTFGHESRLLTAPTSSVAAVDPSTITKVTVTATPNAVFGEEATAAVDALLDECATQQVLQPSGCPFGTVIDDRLLNAPEWSIAQAPAVQLTADTTGWLMAPSIGYAHIDVKVRSLFDGSIDTIDDSVSFVASYRFALGDDDVLTLLPAG
jgi:hypothetical protein